MKISVVIPTFNRPGTIESAIEKILENTVQPDEIIIVDQSVDNLTFEALSKLIEVGKVAYIKEVVPNVSRARNIGWRKAIGDVIAFTDDDATVDAMWIENIKKSFEREDLNIGVLGGRIVPLYEDKNPDWVCPERWEYLLPVYDQGNSLANFREGAFPATVNYAIARNLLEKFNGFDESFGVQAGRKIQISGEDTELSLRIKDSSFNLVYNPNCIVHHPVPLSRQSSEFLRKRILEEGACTAYTKIKAYPTYPLVICLMLLKSLINYLYFKSLEAIGINTDEDLCYLQGRIIVLFKCGLLKQELQSF
jgi:glucosyl-dolichyl phosphate glucuronosyltransferase